MRSRDIAMVAVLIFLSGATGYLARRSGERDSASPAVGATPVAEHSTSGAATKETATRRVRSTNLTSTHERTPLPAADAPLAQTFDELKKRADAGDTEAADRLFHDVNRCFTAREIEQNVSVMSPIALDATTDNSSPEMLQAQDVMLQGMQNTLEKVKKARPLCANVPDDDLDQFVPITLQAAQLGSQRAISCYLGSALEHSPGLLDHPEWLTQFKQNAMALAQSGIEQGNWTTVGLLGNSYSGFFRYSLLGQVTGIDPALAYRYIKLEQLGATEKFGAAANTDLANAAQRVTADQIAAGDAWAQDTFSRYFTNTSSNVLSNGVNICQGLDE